MATVRVGHDSRTADLAMEFRWDDGGSTRVAIPACAGPQEVMQRLRETIRDGTARGEQRWNTALRCTLPDISSALRFR